MKLIALEFCIAVLLLAALCFQPHSLKAGSMTGITLQPAPWDGNVCVWFSSNFPWIIIDECPNYPGAEGGS